MIDDKKHDEMTWEERQKKVAEYLANFFDPEMRKKMIFVSNAPKDFRTFDNPYYR